VGTWAPTDRHGAVSPQTVRKKFARRARHDVQPVCHDVQIVVEQVAITVEVTAAEASRASAGRPDDELDGRGIDELKAALGGAEVRDARPTAEMVSHD
jgi:hypothetical protein